MQRAFHLLDELPDVIEGKSLFQPEIASDDLERLPLCRGAPAGQASSEHVVYNLAKRSAGATPFGLQLCCHVVIQGECRSHIMMVWSRHLDVKLQGFCRV